MIAPTATEARRVQTLGPASLDKIGDGLANGMRGEADAAPISALSRMFENEPNPDIFDFVSCRNHAVEVPTSILEKRIRDKARRSLLQPRLT